jgi:hypothetical protein
VNRDIPVKTFLAPEEFVAMVHAADDAGLSQSAYVRTLIKREIVSHAMRVLALQQTDSTRPGQD